MGAAKPPKSPTRTKPIAPAEMDNGILCPPHSQHLSDSTIGDVILRSNVRRHNQTISARYFRGGTIVGAEAPAQLYSQTDPWSLTGSSARSAFVSTDKRIRTALTTLCVKMPSHTIPPELLEAMVQSEAKVREQRRVTQQRYRKKMDQRTKSLENDTLRLQEETHRLELQYNCLISQTPTEETPWSVVAEYYRLFRYGSQVPESTKQALYLNEAQIQTNFLHRTMAQTISVNSGFGIDALLQEWRFVPPMAGDLTVQLLRLEYDDRAAMLATVKVFVTITEDMLRLSFSHLVSTDNRLSPFAEKLLREKIVVPVTVRFEWDNTTAQVVSMHSTPDLFTPFTKVLGNLKDAARVLVNSRLAVALGAAS